MAQVVGQAIHRGCVVLFQSTGVGPHLCVQARIMKAGAVRGIISHAETSLTEAALQERVRAAAFDFIDHELQEPDSVETGFAAFPTLQQLLPTLSRTEGRVSDRFLQD